MFPLPVRAILARPVPHLRWLSSATERPWPVGFLPSGQKLSVENVVEDVENTPSTHRGAPRPQSQKEGDGDIFSAWQPNSYYAPLDFLRSRRIKPEAHRTVPRAVGPGAKISKRDDPFIQLDIDPVFEANNAVLLGAFMTGMGKIRPRSQTGLSWRSQRRVGKAIRRAKQKGILPLMSNIWSRRQLGVQIRRFNTVIGGKT